MSTATSSEDLSHCLLKAGQNMGQVSERSIKNRTRRHVLRAQALLTLLACGPLNKIQLAKIIAVHTGRKSESVRRNFEGERDVLRALEEAWLIEKSKEGLLTITPLGMRALENTISIGPLVSQAAKRLEEWEQSLRGLSCVISRAQRAYLGYQGYTSEHIGETLHYLLEIASSTLAQDKYPKFDGNTGLEVLKSLNEAFFPFTIETLVDLLREREKTRSLPDLNEKIEKIINELVGHIEETVTRAYEAIIKCKHGSCSREEEKKIERLFEDSDDYGLLIELNALNQSFVERATGWPGGRPPLRARLALREAGSLLRGLETASIVAGLDYCSQEKRVSKLLAPLLAVHAVNRLVLDLEETYSDLDAFSRHYGTLAVAFTNLRGKDLRQTLAFLVLLRDVIARFREYWIDTILELQGKKRRSKQSLTREFNEFL